MTPAKAAEIRKSIRQQTMFSTNRPDDLFPIWVHLINGTFYLDIHPLNAILFTSDKFDYNLYDKIIRLLAHRNRSYLWLFDISSINPFFFYKLYDFYKYVDAGIPTESVHKCLSFLKTQHHGGLLSFKLNARDEAATYILGSKTVGIPVAPMTERDYKIYKLSDLELISRYSGEDLKDLKIPIIFKRNNYLKDIFELPNEPI